MRFTLCLFIIFLCSPLIWANETIADSLKTLLIKANNQQERMYRYLDLDNYYRNMLFIDSIPLTRVLLEEGIKARNEYIISDALRKLVMSVDRKERVITNDSIIHYLNVADKHLTGERKRSFITEVRLRHIRSKADWTENEAETIEELTAMYTTLEDNSNDIYFQIERNYALGMAAALSMSENRVNAYQNASRYYDRLFELIQKLPVDYGPELLFWVNENIYTTYLNAQDDEKVVSFLESMMDILKHYKLLPNIKKDVYQNFEFVYSVYYEGIAHFPSIVGYEKALECLMNADRMHRKRDNMLSVYYSYKAFYKNIQDHKNFIAYGDSVINFFQGFDFPGKDAVIASIYKEQAESYNTLGDNRNAYGHMLKYDEIQEKITNEGAQKLRANMDARYDLTYLALEKERLISHNRQVVISFFLFILVLSITWGISRQYHINKLKRMQKKLLELNAEVIRQSELAKEGEKMKTAFVNSMCHEIRTPLNAISGFSNLILDEDIDAECKKEFAELIQGNTDALSKMLNNLMEVSNLSNSTEILPMDQVDIRMICIEQMELLKLKEGKEDIVYTIEIEEGFGYVCTNAFYLSQTLTNLLSNANKFTERGQITLGCYKEPNEQWVIKVTDTGVGIPIDKQEWVFERFTKLDEFKPGVGIGLCICRLIVHRLGGTIRIDSEYTGGTSFILTFPAHFPDAHRYDTDC